MVQAWNALFGEVVDADAIITFKGHLDGHVNKQGMRDIDNVQVDEINLNLHHGQHGHCGLFYVLCKSESPSLTPVFPVGSSGA